MSSVTTPSLLNASLARPMPPPLSSPHDPQQLLVQRVVGFTLASLTCAGSLFLLVFASLRLCGRRRDLVHGLGVHAALLGFWQGAYVMTTHTLATAFPLVRLSRLWRLNCAVYSLARLLLPSVFLALLLVLLLAYWTASFPGRRARSAPRRCLFALAHAGPWAFGLAATLPLFAWREAAEVWAAGDARFLCERRIGDQWSLVTLAVSRGGPLVGHGVLTLAVTLRRRGRGREEEGEVRRMPLVVLLYFLIALGTEGSFLVSRTIEILVARTYGKAKFSPVERRALAWTQFCHFCLAPVLMVFLVAHVSSELRRIGREVSKKHHVVEEGPRREVLYTNCMLTSL